MKRFINRSKSKVESQRSLENVGVPNGIRTRVPALIGRRWCNKHPYFEPFFILIFVKLS